MICDLLGAKREGFVRGGQVYVFHADRLGSIRWVTDGGQNIVVRYVYEGFGKVVGQEGMGGGAYQWCGIWGYRNDHDGGLMHVGARYYEVETGRWVQKDPWLGDIISPQSLNLFVYCINNPIEYIDAKGHRFKKLVEKFTNWTEKFKDWAKSIWGKVSLIALCYQAYEDLHEEIVNPEPPKPIHDAAHLIGAVNIIMTGAAVGGVLGGGALVIGAIYGAWHLAKLLEVAL